MIYLNDEKIVPTIFPDKTSQIWKVKNIPTGYVVAKVVWIFENEGEFLHLAQLKTLLDYYNVLYSKLTMHYLPYGRQDKEVSNDTTFALTTFAKLLNSLNFQKVTIVDPHSPVASTLIHNCEEWYPQDYINSIMFTCKTDVVCYPDDGAYCKYVPMYQFSQPHIHGEKVRDQLTGNITSYKLINDLGNLGNIVGKSIMIIDDICDGGMTFKLLAKDLLAAGAKEVNLFVTHGIFSKGLKTLKDSGINRIFTQDGEKSE